MSTEKTTSRSRHRVALVDQLTAEWRSAGRAPAATRALRAVARRDRGLAALVLGSPPDPPPCPTPFDVVEHLRRASGRAQREEAARLVRVLLREAGSDPFVSRMLVQALLPGLIAVAAKLRWGQGGEWQDAAEFFGELLSTTWLVLQDWAGQDRPYATLDLLSAIRCRLRRQLFRGKDLSGRTEALDADALPAHPGAETHPARPETDLEELTRRLLELHRCGARTEDVQVLYAHHVLGYSIAELAAITGRDRRTLSARRDRGLRRLCA